MTEYVQVKKPRGNLRPARSGERPAGLQRTLLFLYFEMSNPKPSSLNRIDFMTIEIREWCNCIIIVQAPLQELLVEP